MTVFRGRDCKGAVRRCRLRQWSVKRNPEKPGGRRTADSRPVSGFYS